MRVRKLLSETSAYYRIAAARDGVGGGEGSGLAFAEAVKGLFRQRRNYLTGC